MQLSKKVMILGVLCALVFSILLSFLILQCVPLARYFVRTHEDYENTVKETEIQYIETIRYATEKEQIEHNRKEVEMLAKAVWGEYRAPDKTKQAAVVWCILNRVDAPCFPDNITDVVTASNQFTGYKESNPIDPEIVELVEDVLSRWKIEDTAVGWVGRVLPKEYCWFRGNGHDNLFRNSYNGDYDIWEWTLDSPYKVG